MDKRDPSGKPDICARLGIPKWQDEAAYPSASNLTFTEWRWEFLRRNPNYRHDYDGRPEIEHGEGRSRFFERVYKLVAPIDYRLSAKDRSTPPAGEKLWFGDSDMFVDDRLSTRYANFHDIARIKTHADPLDLFCRVMLDRPLKPQFDALCSLAQESQSRLKVVRAATGKWPLYLRVIDAQDCGASYSEIALILGHTAGTKHTARDYVKQAVRLRDHWPF